MPDTDKSSDLPLNKLKQQLFVETISGFTTGAFCSGLFNPWDRALYLAVAHNRGFLSIENFTSPYQGFSQAIVQRTILGSLYYIAQGSLKSSLYPYLINECSLSENKAQFCLGMAAGSISGALTNPISAIKYHTWGQANGTFLSSYREMRGLGGIRPFFKGTPATIARDMAFGSTYELLRSWMQAQLNPTKNKSSGLDFMCNTAAASVATVVSGPFNYTRVMQFATPPNLKPPTVAASIKGVIKESTKYSIIERPGFFQKRFQVGWGTARVALGMAVGQELFDRTKETLEQCLPKNPRP